MADAFGLVASAAGIVSLGLQVYTGISSYVEGIKDRKTELSAVTRQADTLQTAVNALQDALPRINAVLSNNRLPLVPALRTVEEELWALRLFLDTLQEQQVPNQTPGFATTMKQQKKRFTFPFHRPTLEKLQKKLESANNALRTSLQVVDLMITASMSTTMSGVHATVHNSQAILMDTRSSIRSLGANVGHMSEEMHQALRTVPMSTATILAEVMDQKFAEMMSRISTESNAPTNISQGQLVMGRLLSKPRDLKDACDLNSALVAHTPWSVRLFQQTYQSCDCHTRTVKYHEAKKFGDFFSIKKGTVQRQHLPGCEFEADNYGSTAHVRAIAYTGLRWILSRSVELSMSWTSGAGGSSISPSITLRPMVDETRSPAFRIINIVSECLEYNIDSFHYRDLFRSLNQILDYSTQAILRTYRGRRCSFYDVNQHGESVLFKWMTLLGHVHESAFRDASDIMAEFRIAAGPSVRKLIPEGSRGSLSNYNAVSPLVKFIDCVGVYELPAWAGDLAVLYSYDHELLEQTRHDIRRSPINGTLMSWELIPIFEESQIMTEILGFGPLSRSIVSQDTKMMRSLLKQNPRVLAEINYALQTPFHLAAETCNPEVFKVLIKAARGFATQFDTPDALGRHALDVLVLSSGDLCGPQNFHRAICPAQISFDMLQSAGWQLSAMGIFLPCEPLSEACGMIKLSFLSTIKQARQDLRAMAHLHLSVYERQRFQIDSPEILDSQAYDVVERLVKMGANLPEGYKTLLQNESFIAGNSVYHNLCDDEISSSHNVDIATLLYCNGFTDVDHKNVYGETPLYLSFRRVSFGLSKLALWFLQHGADASRTLPVKSTHERPVRNLRIAHQILDLSRLNTISKSRCPIFAEIIRNIAPLQIYDECFCGCVEAGCTTTTNLFRSLWKQFFVWKRRSLFKWSHDRDSVSVGSLLESTSISEHGDDSSSATEELEGIDTRNEFSAGGLATEEIPQTNYDNEGYHSWLRKCTHRLSEFLRALQLDFAQWSHVSSSALRFLTFQALGIRHTCHCGLSKGIGPPCRHHSDGVIKEMQEEDRELLNTMEELVEDSVEKLECSGDTFERFLTGYWVSRIEVVLRHLEAAKMSPEQVRAAEEVGVIWEACSVSESEVDYRSDSSDPDLSELVELLVNQIDEIVAEST